MSGEKNWYNLMAGENPPPCPGTADGKHDFKPKDKPEGNNSGWHNDECTRCHVVVGYDTSD